MKVTLTGAIVGIAARSRGEPCRERTGPIEGLPNGAPVRGPHRKVSFGGTGGSIWQLVGGTSESTPLFAGIVAMADQLAGHRLGDINSGLYFMGEASRVRHVSIGIVDITPGNNSFAGLGGYEATPGYDLASGWGTVDGYKFVHTLVRL